MKKEIFNVHVEPWLKRKMPGWGIFSGLKNTTNVHYKAQKKIKQILTKRENYSNKILVP